MSNTEASFNAKTAEQVQHLADFVKSSPEKFSEFERNFIQDSSARVHTFGGDQTYFSEKQANLIARIHDERIVQCKAPGKK